MIRKNYLAFAVSLLAWNSVMAQQTMVLPWEIDNRISTSSSQTVSGEALEKYPSLDLRNSLTGQFSGLFINENYGYSGWNYSDEDYTKSFSSRYFGATPLVLINGYPAKLSVWQLDPEEIESITYISDIAHKVLYGTDGTKGILNIVLKRGASGKPTVKVSAEGGVSIVDRFPEWVDAAGYAYYYNISRINAGKNATFTNNDIRKYMSANAYDQFYPNVDWRAETLGQIKPYTKSTVALSGGKDALTYNVHFGWAREGDIYKVGEKADFNRFNLSTVLDFIVNENIRVDVNVRSSVQILRQPIFGTGTKSDYPLHDLLQALLVTRANRFPITTEVASGSLPEDSEGMTVYAMLKGYENPYANLAERGGFTQKGSVISANAAINWDLKKILRGLKSRTSVYGGFYNMSRLGQNPDYLAYIYSSASPSTQVSSHVGKPASGNTNYGSAFDQDIDFYQKFSYDWANERHSLNTALIFNMNHNQNSSCSYFNRQIRGIAYLKYTYRNRLVAELTGNYSGSMELAPKNRYRFYPAMGLAYNADHVRIYAQAGILGYESYGQKRLYMDSFDFKEAGGTMGPYTSGNTWFGTTTQPYYYTTYTTFGNQNLRLPEYREVVIGADMSFLQNRLSARLSAYRTLADGMLVDSSDLLPAFYGLSNSSFWSNYNSKLYYGVELSVGWKDRVGDFTYSISASALAPDGRILKQQEIVSYPYQSAIGTRNGEVKGYIYLGKYQSEEDIASSPENKLYDKVAPGDLKYKDINGDNVIDSNDRTWIGNTEPRLRYALNLYFRFRNVDLTVCGTGAAFADAYLTNLYFFNGWGEGDNSMFSRFMVENEGGLYPSFNYNKNTNNFVVSNFWRRDGGFFKIQNVELGWDILSGSFGLRLFARGANVLTLTKVKYVDPESLDAGVSHAPLFRTFTGGIQFRF